MISAKSKPPPRRSQFGARATPKRWRNGPVSERPRQTQGTSFVLLSFFFSQGRRAACHLERARDTRASEGSARSFAPAVLRMTGARTLRRESRKKETDPC